MIAWLPDLVPYDSDWEKYSETLYSEYLSTYRSNQPLFFNDKKVIAPAQPKFYDKSEAFWHLIGGGDNVPDADRCERIRWARAIIEHCECEEVLVFSERRGRQHSTLFWLKTEDYLVVINERPNYYILKTAYMVKHKHKIKTLEKLYRQAQTRDITKRTDAYDQK